MYKNNEVVLKLEGIYKRFGGVKALQDVKFSLKKGEIHGLVGENGAGKTTLANIIKGNIQKDQGNIYIKGIYCKNVNPKITKKYGIAVLPQIVQTVPDMSIPENIFLNNWPKNKSKFVNWKEMKQKTVELCRKVGLNINTEDKIENLSYVDRQMISILRFLFVEKAEIIILDEPTAPLIANEINMLFSFIELLRSKGVSFIYISHYLYEIFQICSRVTVLRDGKFISTKEVSSLKIDELVKDMLGENIKLYTKRISKKQETVILEIKNFAREHILKNVNFVLKKGEILGIAGLKGSGRTELARSICGLDKYDKGEIIFDGEIIQIRNVNDAFSKGIGYLTEDRQKWGIMPIRPISENLTLPILDRLKNKLHFIDLIKEEQIVKNYVSKLEIKTPNIYQEASTLSGGNQQKIIVSRLLASELKIYFFDDPTFGIDIKAKMNIHQIMNSIVEMGNSIVLISSDINELHYMSDRIILLKNGKIEKEFLHENISVEKLQRILEEGEGE